MPLLSILRDQANSPFIVRITTSDDLATITTTGYLNSQRAVIISLNNGNFEWIEGDMVAVSYLGGSGLFNRDSQTNSLIPINEGTLSNALPNGQIFIGNVSNIATPRSVSGQVSMTNTGVTSIAPNSVTLGQVFTGWRPLAIIVYEGQFTTVGGSATEVFATVGSLSTDRLFTQMVDRGSSNVNILSADVGNDQITVVFSANPGNDAKFNWQINRLGAF